MPAAKVKAKQRRMDHRSLEARCETKCLGSATDLAYERPILETPTLFLAGMQQLLIKLWDTFVDRGPWQIKREAIARAEVRIEEMRLVEQAKRAMEEIGSSTPSSSPAVPSLPPSEASTMLASLADEAKMRSQFPLMNFKSYGHAY